MEIFHSAGILPKSSLSSSDLSLTLTTMVDGLGYWINMTHADTLYVLGYVILPASSPPTYSLSTGWNLIGFKPGPTIQSEPVSQE